MNNQQNFESDYLKTRENDLEQLHQNHFKKIIKIDEKLKNCEYEKCMEFMIKNYENQIVDLKNSISLNTKLLFELDNLKLGNCDDVDIELSECSREDKKSKLLKCHMRLIQSKSVCRKIVSNLLKELETHQKREHDLAASILNNDNRINTHKSHFNQIENDVNNEVQRLEKVFLRNYKQKMKKKFKFDKLNKQLISETVPRLMQLERDFQNKNSELMKVEEEIVESRRKLEEYEEAEKIYGSKLKELEKTYEKFLTENERMEKYLLKLKIEIASYERKIMQSEKIWNENSNDLKENSSIMKRIKELQIEDLEIQLKNLKLSTMCQLKSQDSIIEILCNNISKIIKEISISNATIETFEKNLKILRKISSRN